MQRLQDDTVLIVLKYFMYLYINAYELSQNFPSLGIKLKIFFLRYTHKSRYDWEYHYQY